MPEYLRPDEAGVIFAFGQHLPPRTPFERFYVVATAISDIAVFSRADVEAAIEMFVEEGSFPVWLSFNGQKWMVYPDADFADAIMNPSTTAHWHLIPQAIKWRRRFGLE
jgi:hypothetical protein